MTHDYPVRDVWKVRATLGFKDAFGRKPTTVSVCPGRVNLIGEHTDYSFGFVLPAAIPLYTAVAVSDGPDGTLEVSSSSFGREQRPSVGLRRRGTFADYVAGAVWACGLEGRGLRVHIDSNLPAGSGLSVCRSCGDCTARCVNRVDIGRRIGDLRTIYG